METFDIVFRLCVVFALIPKGTAYDGKPFPSLAKPPSDGTSFHCAVRKEISPCTCRNGYPDWQISKKVITVLCRQTDSFVNIVAALKEQFDMDVEIILEISHSKLEDLHLSSFQVMGINITKLLLIHDNLSYLPDTTFGGVKKTKFFSLVDNLLPFVPKKTIILMPNLVTIDLGKNCIENITSEDFQGLPFLQNILLPMNNITLLEEKCFPSTVTRISLYYNKIRNLNGTIRYLEGLEWLVLSHNLLESLEDELPKPKFNSSLKLLSATHNRIKSTPKDLLNCTVLEILDLRHNEIAILGGAISNARKLKSLDVSYNQIEMLGDDEFIHLEKLEDLELGFNKIKFLNSSLLPLKSLKKVNLTHNNIEELNFGELRGLDKLEHVILTFNGLHRLSIKSEEDENEIVTADISGTLDLSYNNIEQLNGSLLTLKSLRTLNLTHNNLKEFSLQDIWGLQKLYLVDLSHNKINHLSGRMENLVELEAKVKELKLDHNKLHTLSGSLMGLHGLRVLNLSHNAINTISPDDLIGLDDLKILDISYNHLKTLEETSKTVLPSLEELYASHNWVRALEKDFHGLPRLCKADLSHNRIATIGPQLTEHTQCQVHNVNSTLRIYLQGNPVLCDENMSPIIRIVEAKNNTKIHGSTDCQQLLNVTLQSQ